MFKNENGFSLVELAIAAGLAVALAATAVTVLSGTTASLSSNANSAAGTSSQYNTDVLANASGVVSNGGNTTPVAAVPTQASILSLHGAIMSDYNSADALPHPNDDTWSSDYSYLIVNNAGSAVYSNDFGSVNFFNFITSDLSWMRDSGVGAGYLLPDGSIDVNGYEGNGFVVSFTDDYTMKIVSGPWVGGQGEITYVYNMDSNGNAVKWL